MRIESGIREGERLRENLTSPGSPRILMIRDCRNGPMACNRLASNHLGQRFIV